MDSSTRMDSLKPRERLMDLLNYSVIRSMRLMKTEILRPMAR
jgi:hypothetical protein